MYNVIRNFADGSKQIIHANLSFESAKSHVLNRENHSNTCTLAVNKARTERLGVWFDTMVEVEETAMTNVSNFDVLIDSRDIIESIEELVCLRDAGEDYNKGKLATLSDLAKQGEESGADLEDGTTLIRYDYFKSYAMELAEDIGAIDHNAQWPNNCIDWDLATRELEQDYMTVEFDGITYYLR